jgi:hypothetical protein
MAIGVESWSNEDSRTREEFGIDAIGRPPARRRRSLAMIRTWPIVCCLAILATATTRAEDPPPGIRPLRHATSWVGNSFGGDGGENGAGYWVQNGVDEIEVTPDGTVFAGISWDEAGRCAGLYKEGRVNRALLKEHDGRGKESAWGWGTANGAVAASGEHLYLANAGKRLLRFRWKPGDLDSAHFVDEVEIGGEAVGLAARGDRIIVVYGDGVETRRAGDLSPIGRFAVAGARDVAIEADGRLWVLAGNSVGHRTAEGKDLGVTVPGLDRPTAVSIDHRGRLLVCDDGRRQQVLTFDVTGRSVPERVAAFGDEGGLLSGTPGRVAPHKLFALRGAGTDAAGNLYVAMGFGGTPAGNCVLRSFDPAGNLRWELYSTAFVDTFGFDPDSDGSVVYGRTSRFDLDLAKREPGAGAILRAITLDHVNHADDDRTKYGCSVVVRNLGGRRLVYMIGQYGGGYRLYTFDGMDGQIARHVDGIHPEGETWAWDVDADGGIWHGDAAGKTIRRYRFRGWRPDGRPDFDWKAPESRPWPADFELVRRVIYEKGTDSLYLFGYLKGQPIETWGVVGRSARRYDSWLAGKPVERWTVRELPTNPKGTDQGTPLTPESVDVAGDYLFAGMVKPDKGRQYTHVLRVSDGRYVGSLSPGPEVGGSAGWQDMPYAIQAMRRKDGEYLVLVEEDWRGKNLLYRWRPADAPLPAARGDGSVE